jgi:hypothetical protein
MMKIYQKYIHKNNFFSCWETPFLKAFKNILFPFLSYDLVSNEEWGRHNSAGTSLCTVDPWCPQVRGSKEGATEQTPDRA